MLAEILAIKPKVIVCLGRHSLSFFFPEAKIGQVHGKVLELKMFDDYTQAILPLYHPAVALYNPGMRDTLQKDFLVIKDLIPELNNDQPTPPTIEKPNTDLPESLF